jgi:hypothetical protein
MKSFKLLGSIGAAALFMAYGCAVEVEETTTTAGAGGSGSSSSSTSTVVGPGPGPTTTAGPSTSTGNMTPDDESSSCANAVELKLGMNNQSGVKFYAAEGILAEPNDKDFFKLSLKKGDWVNIGTQANPDDDPMLVDTVVSLLSADGKDVYAEVDDSFPRSSTDTNFDYRVPADGTYCFQVQEFSAWAGMDPEGDPNYQYALVVVPYDADNVAALGGLTEDKEPNNIPTEAQTLAQRALQSGQEAGSLYGVLEPDTDVDVFKFKTPKGAQGLYLNFQPSGSTNGNGSTGNIGLVNVWNAAGTAILAQLDYGQATAQVKSSGDYGFSSIPAMAETDYFIEVKRKAGAPVGANDFYIFTGFTADALNPQETDDTANGMLAGAEPTMGTVNQTDPTYTNRFIGGGIPAGDTDFWKFDASKDDNVIVACSARRAGAGVEDFTVTLVDKDGKTLQTEVEDPSKDLLWSNDSPNASQKSFKVTAGGSYYLKLTATKTVTDGATLAYYLCGLHTQTP